MSKVRVKSVKTGLEMEIDEASVNILVDNGLVFIMEQPKKEAPKEVVIPKEFK